MVLARDRDDLARHIRGVVRGQKDDDIGHLPGLGPPAEELVVPQLIEGVVGHDPVEKRVESQAGRDRVHPHPGLRPLDGGGPGEAMTPALAAA